MKPLHTILALGLSAALLPACVTTKPVAEWRDPKMKEPLRRVAVAFVSEDPARRRIVEDGIVSRLPPGSAIASYAFMPAGSERDVEAVKRLLAEQKADGALVVKVAGFDRTERLTAAAPQVVPAYSYWGMAYTAVYYPTTVEMDTNVYVDSRLFALTSEQLVWALTVESQNPDSPYQARTEVTSVITQQLVASKVIASAPAGK